MNANLFAAPVKIPLRFVARIAEMTESSNQEAPINARNTGHAGFLYKENDD
jgi:hypothetical protein